MKSLLLVFLCIASSAHAEIYTWNDSRGTAHYTNSLYEIPARFRERVKVLNLGIEQKAVTPPGAQIGIGGTPSPASPPLPVVETPVGVRQKVGERRAERGVRRRAAPGTRDD